MPSTTRKLSTLLLKEGEEMELVNMVIECYSQERPYSIFYGLVGERFCKLNRVWNESFDKAFETYYNTIHRFETNRLRNIARLFGHPLAIDAISWTALQVIGMNEDDTTSSSRIFVKIMMQEVRESMGLPTLNEHFADPEIKALCTGKFSLDYPTVKYFTSIGLGALAEDMREHLKDTPHLILEQRQAMLEAESSSDSSPDPDSSSDSDSESDCRMTLTTAARLVVRRPCPVNTGGILPAADEMTVGRHLHRLVTVGTRHGADATMASHASPPRSPRDDGRSGYGRNRRESPSPPAGRYRRRSDFVLEDATSFAFAFSATARERTGLGPGPFS